MQREQTGLLINLLKGKPLLLYGYIMTYTVLGVLQYSYSKIYLHKILHYYPEAGIHHSPPGLV